MNGHAGARRAPAPGWGRGLLVLFAGVAVTAAVLPFDVALMQWRSRLLQNLPVESAHQVVVGFRNFGQILSVAMAVWIVAVVDRRRSRIVAALVLAQLISMGAYNGIKSVCARTRPYTAIAQADSIGAVDVMETWGGLNWRNTQRAQQSFPSGHTAAAFALAGVLAVYYPSLRGLWWLMATGCAVSRYIDVVHWPSDCIAGATLGYLCAVLALRLTGAGRGSAAGRG